MMKISIEQPKFNIGVVYRQYFVTSFFLFLFAQPKANQRRTADGSCLVGWSHTHTVLCCAVVPLLAPRLSLVVYAV